MEEKEKQQKTKEVHPGWNDPPLFSFESQEEARCRQSRNKCLNKRVVFPISSCAENQKASNSNCIYTLQTSSSSPPKLEGRPPKSVASPFNNCRASELTMQDQSLDDKTQKPSLDVIRTNLNDIFQQVYSVEENKEAEEIKRRLAIMEKMWSDGNFNASVQEKLFKLFLALKEDRFEDSESLQRILMVDYSNVCTLWMAAVRKLIYRKREYLSKNKKTS